MRQKAFHCTLSKGFVRVEPPVQNIYVNHAPCRDRLDKGSKVIWGNIFKEYVNFELG